MKKLNAIVLALLSAGVSGTALAQQSQVEKNDIYVGARLGVFAPDSERVAAQNNVGVPVDNGLSTWTGGLELGVMLTEAWEARVYYDYMEADLDPSGTAYGKSYGTDVLYHFNDMVYGGLGLTSTDIGDIADKSVRLTVGHRSFINNNLAWRVEGGVQQGFDEDYTEGFANVGLQYFFGGRNAVTEAKPRPAAAQPTETTPAPQQTMDSDNDGVIDSRDKCADTPRRYSVDADGCTMYESETVREQLLVEFDFDSSQVRKDAMEPIAEMAEFMNEHPQLDLTIHGHTDKIGDAEYNQWLSQRRAESVKNVLVESYGISASRINTVGHGESQPKVKGDSPADRQENRRIEAELKVMTRVPVIEK
ncbi:MAG: OmpA family protein [Pseudomonadota bacterium]|nr:OprF [Idiomarinaceae bacterium]MEC8926528.1 OmpA family protein [Pseudomonadota bacterium]